MRLPILYLIFPSLQPLITVFELWPQMVMLYAKFFQRKYYGSHMSPSSDNYEPARAKHIINHEWDSFRDTRGISTRAQDDVAECRAASYSGTLSCCGNIARFKGFSDFEGSCSMISNQHT